MNNLPARLKHWLVLIYGITIFVMVVLFYFNFNGALIRMIGEKLQGYIH